MLDSDGKERMGKQVWIYEDGSGEKFERTVYDDDIPQFEINCKRVDGKIVPFVRTEMKSDVVDWDEVEKRASIKGNA